jgi:two-component system, response regulator PdtaR
MTSDIEGSIGVQEYRNWHSGEPRSLQMPTQSVTGRRILVVEDDALLGALLAETLGDLGHEVCAIAMTEADAVAEAALHKPSLLIVDVNLGDGSGIVAVQRILGVGFIPHIYMSGDISSVRMRQPGAVTLQKPFKEPDLIRAIQQAFETEIPS